MAPRKSIPRRPVPLIPEPIPTAFDLDRLERIRTSLVALFQSGRHPRLTGPPYVEFIQTAEKSMCALIALIEHDRGNL